MAKLEVLNPATNDVIETLEYTDEAAINKQIENAQNAFESWKEVDAHTRSQNYGLGLS